MRNEDGALPPLCKRRRPKGLRWLRDHVVGFDRESGGVMGEISPGTPILAVVIDGALPPRLSRILSFAFGAMFRLISSCR
jgi:hypothetical protein